MLPSSATLSFVRSSVGLPCAPVAAPVAAPAAAPRPAFVPSAASLRALAAVQAARAALGSPVAPAGAPVAGRAPVGGACQSVALVASLGVLQRQFCAAGCAPVSVFPFGLGAPHLGGLGLGVQRFACAAAARRWFRASGQPCAVVACPGFLAVFPGSPGIFFAPSWGVAWAAFLASQPAQPVVLPPFFGGR